MQSVILKPLAKGQVTIPAAFRRALKLDQSTVFRADLRDRGIFLQPISTSANQWEDQYLRDFSDQEVTNYIAADRMDPKLAKAVKRYLES